jgi:hypothetical protein
MYSKLATKMSVAVELITTREQERDEAQQIAREACAVLKPLAELWDGIPYGWRTAALMAGDLDVDDASLVRDASQFLARPDVQRLLAMEGR